MPDVIVDGREAERLLADPAFVKAMDAIEAQYVARWKMEQSPARREHFHACVTALGDLRGQLAAMKSNKAMAEASDKTFGRATTRK